MDSPPMPGQRLSPEAVCLELDRIRPRVLRALRARMPPALHGAVDPEDLWQEASLAALAADALEWRGAEAFLRWVMTIAARSLTRELRRRLGKAQDRPAPVSIEELASALVLPTAGPATRAQRHDEADRILRAIQELPPRERQVLTLDFVHLMTQDEMVAALGSTPDAVRKAHFRAVRAIRAALGE